MHSRCRAAASAKNAVAHPKPTVAAIQKEGAVAATSVVNVVLTANVDQTVSVEMEREDRTANADPIASASKRCVQREILMPLKMILSLILINMVIKSLFPVPPEPSVAATNITRKSRLSPSAARLWSAQACLCFHF